MSDSVVNDIERLVILNMVKDVGSIRTQELLAHFGSPEGIFKACRAELKDVEGIGSKASFNIMQGIRDIDIEEEMGLAERHGVKVITFLDRDYPEGLKNIYDPPVVLYVKGRIMPQDGLAIAIVGSRRASFYGIETAERLGFELASRGISIVSGLARGIDSSAHNGALKANARTIAVLGSGLGCIYPEEHKDLAERISENGAVISEFPMMAIPDKRNFPKRNRIISGLSLGVIVVEAARKSGALITADCALQEGREVFAVPGKVDSITSRGTNRLIKQGARLVETADDVLEELKLDNADKLEDYPGTRARLDKSESLVYNLLSSDARHIDELSKESGMGVIGISRTLLNLEMKRLVKQLPGKNFVRNAK